MKTLRYQMMNYTLLTIYFIQLCCRALGALPAPVNLSVVSVNFEHNLRWDPGLGTPPGTTYRVQYSPCGSEPLRVLNVSGDSVDLVKRTLWKCTTDVLEVYTIEVQAVHHGRVSPWSEIAFTPYTETRLGPPVVTVAGCGDCLNLTITLPRGKAQESLQEIYSHFNYHIFWKRAGESKVWNLSTGQSSHVLQNLEPGVEHCVLVELQVNTNKHTLPSDWSCAFTSPKGHSLVPAVLACVSALLVLGGMVLLGLSYVGFLCKMKTHLPSVLTSLVEARPDHCYFSAEETVTFLLEVCDREGGRRLREGSDQEEEDEEEEEEEEEDGGNGGYDRRAARRLEGSGSDGRPRDATGSSDTSAPGPGPAPPLAPPPPQRILGFRAGRRGRQNPLGQTETEFGVRGEGEGGGRGATGASGQREDGDTVLGEREDGDTVPGEREDVNLLSVTLGALAEDGGDMGVEVEVLVCMCHIEGGSGAALQEST
ncbi:hypothetical protein AAFF_G00230530 [Aldrovandia affinis]|uniref:Fibronectin type-III domain-containing protein n=1 Tax=Aldrovandia affinis TaxID=143900 RepID=A0AAD7RF24_9TELE|nr:hypothetical protein AAFF_G00230530 [Aldrovandia affinis]